MKGLILDFEHFAIHDGPGIRQVVFLKGCPLRCIWCHTPESQSGKEELIYSQERCLKCGSCGNIFSSMPRNDWSREELAAAENCPAGALKSAGKWMSADEVIAGVLKERMFFEESSGGLTVSGGEPLFQAEFTTELLRLAQENRISSCVETCGMGSYQHLYSWLDATEYFLYDFKAADPETHCRLTGADNRIILENLQRLSADGANILLRCPLIPGVNDSAEHLLKIAETAGKLDGIKEVHIIPYHPMAKSQYHQLGRESEALPDDFPEQSTVDNYVEIISARTGKKVIVP